MNSNLKYFYEKVKHSRSRETFDFSVISNNCGTAGCLLGELPYVFPEHWKFAQNFAILRKLHSPLEFVEDVMIFFDITLIEMKHIFYPNHQIYGKQLGFDASIQDVLNNLRDFINTKE